MISSINRALKIKDKLVEIRRKIHKYPEIGLEEFRTADLVAKYLSKLGLEVTKGIANTGVVAVIKGVGKGPTIALRADMDALPIQEQNNHSYVSLVKGKMHACGHDGHTAILLGVAKLLTVKRRSFKGKVKLIFQPAEEIAAGALPMIKQGVLINPKVDMMFGLHIAPTNGEVGQISLATGAITASTKYFKLRINGFGGHGAHPHKSVDAIIAAAHVITALQTIASREINSLLPIVISIGTIHGGYRHNVIADEVEMTGTIRTLDEDIRVSIDNKIERIVSGICNSLRCSYELEIKQGLPSLINNNKATAIVKKVAEQLLGENNVFLMAHPSMGGDDFSYFSERVPCCYFRLHAGNKNKLCTYPLHHPKFNFDEDCLPYGVALLTDITLTALKEFG
ncbi:amidohydrolase [Clostridium sp. 'deep sea']|uniref:M20 metallopeptidase family protein n=1 Tax=Clostridium sp. 'deep sea' TaxID=2779445 RepID=UPI00189698D3|nr:amidohydrolase [Clostridium sp. 'deep sea']QOR34093.1 amidohydrolase [Clostridium sp. 'deep sea']